MTTVIVMPGTGSDADFAERVFGPAAAGIDAELIALEPSADLLAGYLTGIDAAAADADDVVVGGISIGAVVALQWALGSPAAARCVGVLAALPPWTGDPGESPAAHSATITADAVERDGIDAAITAMRDGSPRWLGDELGRSWRALHDRGLVAQLRAASALPAPTLDAITRLRVPLGVAVASDDPLHPASVGYAWADAAPVSAVRDCPLSDFGPRADRLGDACMRAWRSAGTGR